MVFLKKLKIFKITSNCQIRLYLSFLPNALRKKIVLFWKPRKMLESQKQEFCWKSCSLRIESKMTPTIKILRQVGIFGKTPMVFEKVHSLDTLQKTQDNWRKRPKLTFSEKMTLSKSNALENLLLFAKNKIAQNEQFSSVSSFVERSAKKCGLFEKMPNIAGTWNTEELLYLKTKFWKVMQKFTYKSLERIAQNCQNEIVWGFLPVNFSQKFDNATEPVKM